MGRVEDYLSMVEQAPEGASAAGDRHHAYKSRFEDQGTGEGKEAFDRYAGRLLHNMRNRLKAPVLEIPKKGKLELAPGTALAARHEKPAFEDHIPGR